MTDQAHIGQDPISGGYATDPIHITVGPVEVVPEQLLVLVEGKRVWLRPREMEVMAFLARNPRRVLSRATIFEAVWNRPLEDGDRSVDVQITKLRRKLADAAPGWDYIQTHNRGGYRFEPEVRTASDG